MLPRDGQFWSAARHLSVLCRRVCNSGTGSLLSFLVAPPRPPDPGRALRSVPVVRVTSPGATVRASSLEGKGKGDRGQLSSSLSSEITSATTAQQGLSAPSPKSISTLACFLRRPRRASEMAVRLERVARQHGKKINTGQGRQRRPQSQTSSSSPAHPSFSAQSLFFNLQASLWFSRCSVAPSLPRPSPSPD